MSPIALLSLDVVGVPSGELTAHGFRGREAISRAYAFDVVVTTKSFDGEALELAALGGACVLTARIGGVERRFCGHVSAIRTDGAPGAEPGWQHRLRVAARMAKLENRRGSRIFQGLRVDEVVSAVLGAAGIAHRWQLLRQHPARAYCTQYRESDEAFVTRLLAESGIFFFFEQPSSEDASRGATETVVLCDDALFYPSIEALVMPGVGEPAASFEARPSLSCVSAEGMAGSTESAVRDFTVRRAARSTSACFMDVDPDGPRKLRAWSNDGRTATSSPIAPSPDARGSADAEDYDHGARYVSPKPDDVREEAALMVRQARRRAEMGRGASGCLRLATGHTFTLDDPSGAHRERGYVVVAVEHRAVATPDGAGAPGRVYDNRFECAPVEVTYCPSRPKRRVVSGVATGTVVGPVADDVHADAQGRVLVRFPWDRRSDQEGAASCWIRTMHALAGPGWGVQFLPRVGMEVVVAFQDGDPNKPIVQSSVYNGSHAPPFALPSDRARSGIRTKSMPGGDGFNELSFDDSAAKEQIFLHAQRNLDEVVGQDRSLAVGRDDAVAVAGDALLTVGSGRSERVAGSRAEVVGVDRMVRVGGNSSSIVGGSVDATVAGDVTASIAGGERRDVSGDTELVVGGNEITRVRGHRVVRIGADDAKTSYAVHVEGSAAMSSVAGWELTSHESVVLRCGKSSIRLTPEGIELSAPSITLLGADTSMRLQDGNVDVRAKADLQVVTDTMRFKAIGASIALAKEAKIDGQRILLNSPLEATDAPPNEPPKPTRIALVDADGEALPHQRYVIELPDGSQRSGVVDGDGKAELFLEGARTIAFPDLGDVHAG